MSNPFYQGSKIFSRGGEAPPSYGPGPCNDETSLLYCVSYRDVVLKKEVWEPPTPHAM